MPANKTAGAGFLYGQFAFLKLFKQPLSYDTFNLNRIKMQLQF